MSEKYSPELVEKYLKELKKQLVSSLNVLGLTTLSNNATIYGTLNISGKSQLVNDTTLLSSLNVSGFTTLSNNFYWGIRGNFKGWAKKCVGLIFLLFIFMFYVLFSKTHFIIL
jgi:hypothetical protein